MSITLLFIVIGFLLAFFSGYYLCFYFYRVQIYHYSGLAEDINGSERDVKIIENVEVVAKDESLERLVNNHNEEMMKGFGDLRNVSRELKVISPINEIEYDEAIFY